MNIIYELGIRPYMITGSDDDKTRLLKELSASDFHFARRFALPNHYYLKIRDEDGLLKASTSSGPVATGERVRKGLALVRPDISGMAQMEYFKEALDFLEKSFPTRRLGVDGVETKMPAVNRKNLLSVITNVNVDSEGNQVPLLPGDPRRHKSLSAVANLWMFRDEKAKAIFALAGRGYMVHGSDSDKTRLLKELAPYDFPMAKALPTTVAVSSDSKYAKNLFDDALRGIVNEIPTAIGLDGKMKNPINISANQLMLNATRITERSSNLGEAAPIQLIQPSRPCTKEQPAETPRSAPEKTQAVQAGHSNSAKTSFFQRLFGK